MIGDERYEYEPNCFGLDDVDFEAVGVNDDGFGVNVSAALDGPGGEVTDGRVQIHEGALDTAPIWRADLSDPDRVLEVTLDGSHLSGTALVSHRDTPDETVEATFDIYC